jgi:uncharacterized protein (TIRG00374 family)
MERIPKLARTVGRYAIGIALLAVLIARSGVAALRDVITTAEGSFVAIAFGLIVLGAVVSVFRWNVFLKTIGHAAVSFARLSRLYAAGLFFNSLLPTGIGGDVFKAVRVRRKGDPMGPAFASVALDRVAGFVGLAILGVAGAIARLASGDHTPVVLVSGATSALIVAGVGVAFGARRLVQRLLPARDPEKDAGRLRRVLDAVNQGTREIGAMARGLSWGIAYQAIVVLFHLALLRSIHVSAPIGGVVCVVVVATFASLLPITINGLGVREGIYVWAFKQYGLSGQEAIVLGLLVLGLLLATSAAGGIVYLFGGFDPPDVKRTDVEGSHA